MYYKHNWNSTFNRKVLLLSWTTLSLKILNLSSEKKGLEILSIIFPFWLLKELIWEVLSLDNNPRIMAKFVQGQTVAKMSLVIWGRKYEFIPNDNSKLV